jgi:hypothetical protein
VIAETFGIRPWEMRDVTVTEYVAMVDVLEARAKAGK